MEDWRLTGQEKYMKGKHLKKIIPSDYAIQKKKKSSWHEHCEFCMKTVTQDTNEEYYTTLDEYRWICKDCFNDFQNEFNWEVEV